MMLFRELSEALAATPDVRCAAELDNERGEFTLTVKFGVGIAPDRYAADLDHAQALREAEAYQMLRHAVGVAQLRAVSQLLGIAPEEIEAMLVRLKGDRP